jgi:hypothetical protein
MYNLYGIVTPFSGIVNRNHLLRKPLNAEKYPKRKLSQIDSLNLLSKAKVLPVNNPRLHQLQNPRAGVTTGSTKPILCLHFQ